MSGTRFPVNFDPSHQADHPSDTPVLSTNATAPDQTIVGQPHMRTRYLLQYIDGSSKVVDGEHLHDSVTHDCCMVAEIRSVATQARPAAVLAREQGTKEGDRK